MMTLILIDQLIQPTLALTQHDNLTTTTQLKRAIRTDGNRTTSTDHAALITDLARGPRVISAAVEDGSLDVALVEADLGRDVVGGVDDGDGEESGVAPVCDDGESLAAAFFADPGFADVDLRPGTVFAEHGTHESCDILPIDLAISASSRFSVVVHVHICVRVHVHLIRQTRTSLEFQVIDLPELSPLLIIRTPHASQLLRRRQGTPLLIERATVRAAVLAEPLRLLAVHQDGLVTDAIIALVNAKVTSALVEGLVVCGSIAGAE